MLQNPEETLCEIKTRIDFLKQTMEILAELSQMPNIYDDLVKLDTTIINSLIAKLIMLQQLRDTIISNMEIINEPMFEKRLGGVNLVYGE